MKLVQRSIAQIQVLSRDPPRRPRHRCTCPVSPFFANAIGYSITRRAISLEHHRAHGDVACNAESAVRLLPAASGEHCDRGWLGCMGNHCRLHAIVAATAHGWSRGGIDAKIARHSNRGAEPAGLRVHWNIWRKSHDALRELTGCRPDSLPLDELLAAAEPLCAPGPRRRLGDHPRGHAFRPGGDGLHPLLLQRQDPSARRLAAPRSRGRLFYNDDFTKLNFESQRAQTGRGARAHSRSPRG